jgi:hypothetical protein
MPDPREQIEDQLRRALGNVRSGLLTTQAQLQEKQRRLRQQEAESAQRRRNKRH